MRKLRHACLWLFVAPMMLWCEELPYRTYTTADGLVRNTITRIRRDPKGYLWLCTTEGLSLFDGGRFTNYRLADGLPDRAVNDLAILTNGSYLVATGAGLFSFHPRRMIFGGKSPPPVFEPIKTASGALTG